MSHSAGHPSEPDAVSGGSDSGTRRIAGRLTGRVTKWVVVAFWIVLLAGSVGLSSKLSGAEDNQQSSFLPGSAESTHALDRLTPFFDPDQIPTVVVYNRPSGLSASDLAALKTQATRIGQMPGVTGKVIGPIPSKDGRAAQTIVTLDFGKDGFDKISAAVDKIRDLSVPSGVSVHVAGTGGQFADSASAFAGIDGTLLFATLGVVILILLITYRSPILWVLPILSAVVSLMISQAVVYLLAAHAGLVVNGQSAGILTVLVVGAGTDYALLLVARYREELRKHEDRHDAMAVALHRAVPAIAASAGTVIVGMLCLVFAKMNSTSSLGPVLAIGVGVTLLVMLTLLPALLVVFGRWLFWPFAPTYGSPEATSSGIWARVGARIARRPRAVWVTTAVVLAAACLGLLGLNATGLNSSDQYTKDFDSLQGQAVLDQHGLTNTSDPIRIVTDSTYAPAVEQALGSVSGLGDGGPDIAKGATTVISRTPGSDDVAGSAAQATVQRVRDAVDRVPGADTDVGGTSAIFLDTEKASTRDNKVIIPIVLIVVLLVLMLLLRAVLAPVLLMLTVVLSFGAALGLSTLVFRGILAHLVPHGAGFDHADASFPLFVFVFLVALGIDYNIFLMTRVREEAVQRGTREGSLVALSATGGVITSAGVVLAATFAVLGSIPLVFLAELGVAVALGVLLDTIIVRSVLVTALNLDLGKRIWWPSRLARQDGAVRTDQTEAAASAT